jgi:hypothetical protein
MGHTQETCIHKRKDHYVDYSFSTLPFVTGGGWCNAAVDGTVFAFAVQIHFIPDEFVADQSCSLDLLDLHARG